jgi:hypothetical protein
MRSVRVSVMRERYAQTVLTFRVTYLLTQTSHYTILPLYLTASQYLNSTTAHTVAQLILKSPHVDGTFKLEISCNISVTS